MGACARLDLWPDRKIDCASGGGMRYEIERTPLKTTTGRPAGDHMSGVERFVESGENPSDALRRFLERDRSVLTGDLMTIGPECVGTAKNDEGLYLLRLCVLDERRHV
jgi:hypothetical protein